MNDIITIQPKEIEVKQYDDPLKDDVPEYLSKEEIHLILENIQTDKHQEFMLLSFLWNTGVRITEAIGVRKSNIDFSTKNIKVAWLKRRKLMSRTLPVNDKFMYLLATYSGGMNKDDLLFPFSRQRACQIIEKYDFVLGKHLHPHLFRHSFAVNYLKQTNDIVGLMKLLGHANIKNTMKYTKIVNADVRSKLNSIDF